MKVGMFFYIISLFISFWSRKVFLNHLGADFIGLTSTLNDILSFLNVAELGIGTSITYFLYKPLQEQNREKINEIMSVLAYLYRKIGEILAVAGLAISLIFPFIFKNANLDMILIFFTFYVLLLQSVCGYIFNYKSLMLAANQQQYITSTYLQTIYIIQNIVQIILAYTFSNLYVWTITGLIFTLIGLFVLNKRIDQHFPWLKTNLKRGKEMLQEYPEILSKTKQIFIHKIKNFLLYRSDQIFIFAFVNLKMVAFYGNYMLIINKVNYLVNIISDGMSAGVGNLVAEGDDKNTMKVFWELTAIRFLITGMIIFVFLLFLQPFITCWLGKEYHLDDIIIYLILFNLFIMLSRGVVEIYIGAYGLFSDVWAAWVELALNIIFTVILGYAYGIAGIVAAKIISVFFIAMFWKPYFLFTRGLKKSVWVYWKGMSGYYILFVIFLTITIFLKHYFTDSITDFPHLILYGICITIPLTILYFLTMFISTNGLKYFVVRQPNLYKALSKIIPKNMR